MIEIPYTDINKIAYEACPKIREKRKEALAFLKGGFDLPGIWPMFYLYKDLTWSVGYNQEIKELISQTMVDILYESTLIEAITLNLNKNYSIEERPKSFHCDHSVKEQKVKEDDPLDPLEVKQEVSDNHPEQKIKRRSKIKTVPSGKKRGRPPKHKD